MKICLCGAKEDEKHDVDCPYPCYDKAEWQVWGQESVKLTVARISKPLDANRTPMETEPYPERTEEEYEEAFEKMDQADKLFGSD